MLSYAKLTGSKAVGAVGVLAGQEYVPFDYLCAPQHRQKIGKPKHHKEGAKHILQELLASYFCCESFA